MARGTSDIINSTLKITDSGTAATEGATGVVDLAKSTGVELKINKDSGTAGLGVVTVVLNKGSSQQFTSADAAWYILKFGSETQKGGILIKTDGGTFTTANLSGFTGATYANCIAFTSDGLVSCKNDGSSWVIIGSYALT